eukprot:CAMPEP_0119368884 /NCGR_PEP_ID=MMETSP1334-20130426/15488_1 /TAXON_ID=127549 /ORGANISM="Calcidiscus leptoporus, Strain RCC1130" /LENGTH=75 /DNA_ID=CAMNT_0007385617 /DNA_START=25 /DNA_END=249 /DNA_ORIENTATION=-
MARKLLGAGDEGYEQHEGYEEHEGKEAGVPTRASRSEQSARRKRVRCSQHAGASREALWISTHLETPRDTSRHLE